MTETQIRNMTNREFARHVLHNMDSNPTEMALANRLLDCVEDLEISEAEPRCACD